MPSKKVTPSSAPLRRETGGIIRPASTPAVIAMVPRASPFLLLPLRLEYRYFPAKSAESFAEVLETGIPMARKATAVGESAARITAPLASQKSPLRFAIRKMTMPELWVRWYPDDVFATSPTPDATPAELAALATFEAVVGQRAGSGEGWWDLSDQGSRDAWQRFVGEVGFSRAVYLARTAGKTTDQSDPTIFGLPDHIELYALTAGKLELVGTGGTITRTLTYEIDDLTPGKWLTDFSQAVRDGMGVKLSGKGVDTTLGADWLIACGLGSTDSRAELERVLGSMADRGVFEFVAQDSPTNNSSRARSDLVIAVDDPTSELPRATFLERRSAADTGVDADRLAGALGIDAAALYRAPGSGNTDALAAESALVALLPGLAHAFGQLLEQERIDPGVFRSLLARHASARGPLPVVRIGHSPYGILPIATPGLAAPGTASAPESAAFSFIERFASTTIDGLKTSGATGRIPVSRASDVARHDVLRRILQTAAVSLAASASDAGSTSAARPVTCPLVGSGGKDPAREPSAYLTALTSTPLATLPDPDRADADWPLLYRLLRLSLELLLDDAPFELKSLGARAAATAATGPLPALSQPLREWVSALDALARISQPQLEVLLFEVLDLLDHRIDAWATGLAMARVRAARAGGDRRLRVGYYGMLERPRATAALTDTDGYVQAPSLAQAITAGLLRSAAIRQPVDGPFQIDLSSRRARKARKSFDLLRKGLELREILGMHAERWLHDNAGDALLYELRQRFPVKRGSGPDAHVYPLIDGEQVLDPANHVATTVTTDRRAAKALLVELAEQKDALADLVVAEAVHQLANGQLGAVTAWMGVLTGGTAPADLDFLATPRGGHSSSHRVAYVSAPLTYAGSDPRRIAEPVLGDLAERSLQGFAACRVRATIGDGASPPGVTMDLDLALDTDLKLDPIDLVCGGQGELWARVRSYVVEQWRTEPTLAAKFGPLADRDLGTFLERTRPLAVDLDHRAAAGPTATELLMGAAALRDLASRARALTVSDLGAGSARASQGLDPRDQLSALTASVKVLRDRAERVRVLLDGHRQQLGTRASAVLVSAREIRRRDGLAQPPTPTERQQLLSALAALRADLGSTFRDLASFAIVEGLTPIADGEVVAAPEQLEAAVTTMQTRIASKLSDLTGAISAADALVSPTSSDAQAVLTSLVAALKAACDGDAISIWPPFPVPAAATPVVGGPTSVAAAIGNWERIRPQLRAARALATALPALNALSTAATETTDPRRPAVSYYGVHIVNGTDLPANEAAGLVIDEWTEVRPSSTQTTALAIDHETPRSEPPHVLLLGVPPHDGLTDWSGADVAAVVRTALELMAVRAASAADASYRVSGLNAFNLIPPSAARGRARIPTSAKIKPTKSAGVDWKFVRGAPPRSATVQARIERAPGVD